ncbi:MAG: CPBP family intramembrane metalloprotease [Elusimicrobiales bacterium]|nr:CPBP family intramembrane metalloprotease [Elusimicrobiales bacterium]
MNRFKIPLLIALAFMLHVCLLAYGINKFFYTDASFQLSSHHYNIYFCIYAFAATLRPVLMILLSWYLCRESGLRESSFLSVPKMPWKDILLGIVAVAVFRFYATPFMIWITGKSSVPGFPGITILLSETMRNLHIYTEAFFCVSDVIIGPIGEEVLYRGYIHTLIKKHFGFLPAIVIVSGLFSLSHWPVLGMSWWNFSQQFIMGIILGILRESSGGILAPIATHQVKNLLVVLFRIKVL